MPQRPRHPREPIYFSDVEAALVAMHRIAPADLMAFRSRTHRLQDMGLVPKSSGRGRRLAYEAQDIYVWATAVELIRLGVAPGTIQSAVSTYRETVQYGFVQWGKGDNMTGGGEGEGGGRLPAAARAARA